MIDEPRRLQRQHEHAEQEVGHGQAEKKTVNRLWRVDPKRKLKTIIFSGKAIEESVRALPTPSHGTVSLREKESRLRPQVLAELVRRAG